MKQSKAEYASIGIPVPSFADKSVCVVARLLSSYYLSSSFKFIACIISVIVISPYPSLYILHKSGSMDGLFVEVMGRCENYQIFLLKSEKP